MITSKIICEPLSASSEFSYNMHPCLYAGELGKLSGLRPSHARLAPFSKKPRAVGVGTMINDNRLLKYRSKPSRGGISGLGEGTLLREREVRRRRKDVLLLQQ